jgi:hypothetical protein
MNAIYVNNGTAYPCQVLQSAVHNGFTEIEVRFTGKSRSVLQASGSHAWVLPSQLHRVGAVKKTRGGVITKDPVSRVAFLQSLPTPA